MSESNVCVVCCDALGREDDVLPLCSQCRKCEALKIEPCPVCDVKWVFECEDCCRECFDARWEIKLGMDAWAGYGEVM